MQVKKQLKKFDERKTSLVIRKQVLQLNVELKRGLLPYVIMFLLRTRPHYSLEILKKMADLEKQQFRIRQNIVYQNLKKLQQKGFVASYEEKSKFGARRKYYYLTELGERLFEEVIITRLYPLCFMFSTIMEKYIEEHGIKRKIPKKEFHKIQNIIDDVLYKKN
jgi:DNA-binding PadR family transcriptional regulator